MKNKRLKWERWLEVIRQQLHAVMRSRLILRETFALIRANPQLPPSSLIYHHLRVWYGDHAIMALRRQIKDSQQSISFVRLLRDIQANAALLTDGQGRALPPQEVDADIQLLCLAAASCERFADKRVAHHDRGKAPSSPSYDELDRALDALDALFRKYYLRVTGKALVSTTPSIAFNWQKAFEHAWKNR